MDLLPRVGLVPWAGSAGCQAMASWSANLVRPSPHSGADDDGPRSSSRRRLPDPPPMNEIPGTPYSFHPSRLDEFRELAERVQGMRASGKLAPEVLYRLRQFFRIKNIYHSNAIEGNQLDVGETRQVVEQGLTLTGRPLKDQAEARNLSAAIDFLEELVQDTAMPIRGHRSAPDPRAGTQGHRRPRRCVPDGAGGDRRILVRPSGTGKGAVGDGRLLRLAPESQCPGGWRARLGQRPLRRGGGAHLAGDRASVRGRQRPRRAPAGQSPPDAVPIPDRDHLAGRSPSLLRRTRRVPEFGPDSASRPDGGMREREPRGIRARRR